MGISYFEIRASNFLIFWMEQNSVALERLKTHPSNSLPFAKGKGEPQR